MRVIAGSAKGRRLQSVPGDSTRPITDRAKEALFSIIGDWIIDTRVLDLFAGTGAVGIESLSRGAAFAQFIDLDRRAYQAIRTNLTHCGFMQQAVVERGDSFAYWEKYQGEPFDLVYIAPPQYKRMWVTALQAVDARPELLARYAAVIVQIHPREVEEVALQHLQEYDRRKYGSVMLIFYAAPEDLEEEQADEQAEDLTSDL